MTNREYLSTLTSAELAEVIYKVIVERIGMMYNSSILGVADWLDRPYERIYYMSLNEYFHYLDTERKDDKEND